MEMQPRASENAELQRGKLTAAVIFGSSMPRVFLGRRREAGFIQSRPQQVRCLRAVAMAHSSFCAEASFKQAVATGLLCQPKHKGHSKV